MQAQPSSTTRFLNRQTSPARGRAVSGQGTILPSSLIINSQQRSRTMQARSTTSMTASNAGNYDVDVAIIGGGPAGSVMVSVSLHHITSSCVASHFMHFLIIQAALLAQQYKLKVILMDPNLDKRWIPNYGVWLEEWQGNNIDISLCTSLLYVSYFTCWWHGVYLSMTSLFHT